MADAETELWLWSKTFAEGNAASVLISTTSVLCNMNVSPLSMITRECHPPLHWPLWDNTAHTSKRTCAHTDTHMQTRISLFDIFHWFVIHKTLSLAFIVLFLQANSRLYLIFFVFSYCYWFAQLVSMSMRTRDSGSDLAFLTSSTQKPSPSPHTSTTAMGGRRVRRKYIWPLWEQSLERRFF